MAWTIQRFIKEYPKTNLKEIKNILDSHFPKHGGKNETNIMLNPFQSNLVKGELDKMYPKEEKIDLKEESLTSYKEDDYIEPRDFLMSESGMFREANFKAYVHQEILDSSRREFSTQVIKKCFFVIRQYISQGSINNFKNCKDTANRGWYRTPLASNHFYLWWTKQGELPLKGLDVSHDTYLFRCIRHHDLHEPIKAIDLKDFDEFTPKLANDFDFSVDPWGETEQLKFINSDEPCRLVNGAPGSGKTSSLLRTIETRDKQNVLYLTWSYDLAKVAENHLKSFATLESNYSCFDFSVFLSEINKEIAVRNTLDKSLKKFSEVISKFAASELDVWQKYKKQLFVEFRAHLLGSFGYLTPDDCASEMIREKYLLHRKYSNTAGIAWKIYKILVDRGQIQEIFPELLFAIKAFSNIRNDQIPISFLNFTRIAVDEVQDLTVVDIKVILELYKKIRSHQKKSPIMLIAGDESQTIRPTAYHWGDLKTLMSEHKILSQDFSFSENLRCPKIINEIIISMNELYRLITKEDKPQKNFKAESIQDEEAHVGRILVKTYQEFATVINNIAAKENIKIIYPLEERPKWIYENNLDEKVNVPSELKGLEFQYIIVVDIVSALTQLSESQKISIDVELENRYKRVVIDQLRVTISRATEYIIFIDLSQNANNSDLYKEKFKSIVEQDIQSLEEAFSKIEFTVVEKVVRRIKEARALFDKSSEKAWNKIKEAWLIINDESFENENDIKLLRYRLAESTINVGFKYLQEQDQKADQVLNDIERFLSYRRLGNYKIFFKKFYQWYRDKGSSPIPFLDSALDIRNNDRSWLVEIFHYLKSPILEAMTLYSKNVKYAGEYGHSLADWLSLIKMSDFEMDEKARLLRENAIDVLLKEDRLDEAQVVVDSLKDVDHLRKGKLYEKFGDKMVSEQDSGFVEKYEDAGREYDFDKLFDDAIRVYRKAGNYEKVLGYQLGELRNMIEWVKKVDELSKENNKAILLKNYQDMFVFLFDYARQFEFTAKERDIVLNSFNKIQEKIIL